MGIFSSRAAAVVTIGSMLSACSTSLISTVERPRANAIQEGVPYRLPVAEVDMTITRLLTRCEVWTATYDAKDETKIVEVKDDKGQFIRMLKGTDRLVRREFVDVGDAMLSVPQDADLTDFAQLELEFKVQVSHEVELADGELLSINPDAMATTFKTSSLDVKYREGTLQLSSINASIEGKEAEALSAGIKLATSVASIALGVPPIPLTGASPGTRRTKDITLCSDAAIAQTKAYAITVKEVARLTTEATNATGQIEALTKKKEAGTASVEDLAALISLTQEAKNLAAKIKDATNEKDRLTKILSISNSRSDFRNVSLPADNATSPLIRFIDRPGDRELEKWLVPLVPSYNDPKVKAEILSNTTVYGVLAPFANQYTCTSACSLTYADREVENSRNGVLYRIPALSLLLVTIKDPSDRLSSIDAQRKQEADLVFETVRIPQLGPVRSLPLRSDWGEKNNLTASFGKDGMPTAVAYTRQVAPGAAALSAADQAAMAVLGIRDQLDAKEAAAEADLVAAEQSEIDALTRRIDLATKQAALEALRVEPDRELADLEAQLARLRLLAAIKQQEDLLAEED